MGIRNQPGTLHPGSEVPNPSSGLQNPSSGITETLVASIRTRFRMKATSSRIVSLYSLRTTRRAFLFSSSILRRTCLDVDEHGIPGFSRAGQQGQTGLVGLAWGPSEISWSDRRAWLCPIHLFGADAGLYMSAQEKDLKVENVVQKE